MSLWYEGKSTNTAGISQVEQCFIELMPEWADYIKVDQSGNIPLYDYWGAPMPGVKVHIMIPGKKHKNEDGSMAKTAPGNKYNDIGYRKNEDGSWTTFVDQSGLTRVKNIEGAIDALVDAKIIEEAIRQAGFEQTASTNTDKLMKISFEASLDDINSYLNGSVDDGMSMDNSSMGLETF